MLWKYTKTKEGFKKEDTKLEVTGICSICGRPAKLYTCSFCGRQVCGNCLTSRSICVQCAQGSRGRYVE
jgi:hypothetical protein